MNWDWAQVGQWFMSSIVGAGAVKLMDLVITRYSQRRSRVEIKVNKVVEYLRELGELVALYRFYAHASMSIAKNHDGSLKKDELGKFVRETSFLEPEPRFDEAIRALKDADIGSAVVQKIATIRMMSSEVDDCALELDSSGDLKKHLDSVYFSTISDIENVLSTKNIERSGYDIQRMIDALNEADKMRAEARKAAQACLK